MTTDRRIQFLEEELKIMRAELARLTKQVKISERDTAELKKELVKLNGLLDRRIKSAGGIE